MIFSTRNKTIYYIIRGSCTIDTGTSVVITGGQNTQSEVFRYNKEGIVENLPRLNIGRGGHACSYYYLTNNTRVKLSYS